MKNSDISRIVVSGDEIGRRVVEMAKDINDSYANRSVVVLGVLKGAFMFFSDIVRHLKFPCLVDFVATSSYGSKGTSSSGVVKLLQDASIAIRGKDVILVDDILDTGMTLSFLSNLLKKREPASLELCVLLDKPERRICDVSAKYVGFEIPDEFVVGYGLGYADKYRNLPYVGVLKNEIWKN